METEKKEEQKENVTVPNIVGMKIKDAKQVLNNVGLELKLNVEEEKIDKENTIIIEQTPKQGIDQTKGSTVMCEIK